MNYGRTMGIRLRFLVPAHYAAAIGVCCAAVLIGCGSGSQPNPANRPPSFYIGEALVGEGAELAHVSVMFGDKNGPVGTAFANSLAKQVQGHPAFVVVLAPNVAVKPSTLLVASVTVTGVKPATQLFGSIQQAVAAAVTDSVAAKVLADDSTNSSVLIVNVFLHPNAEDVAKLYQNNYEATRLAIKRAVSEEPTSAEIQIQRKQLP